MPMIDGKTNLKLGVFELWEEAESNARIAVDMGWGKVASATPVWIAWRAHE